MIEPVSSAGGSVPSSTVSTSSAATSGAAMAAEAALIDVTRDADAVAHLERCGISQVVAGEITLRGSADQPGHE